MLLPRFQAMKNMCKAAGPSTFFNFTGDDSGLQPQNMQFPSGAFTFCTWIRLEKLTGEGQNARLLSFFDRSGSGIVADFSGAFLNWKIFKSKAKASVVRINYPFEPLRWYFIAVSQSKKFIFGSENLQFYLDGDLKFTEPLK